MSKHDKEVVATQHLQGVPPKGKQHQWELMNHPEIVHMCAVCGQQTRVIWQANGECLGYFDLFQDYKGGPRMLVEHPDEIAKQEKEWDETAPKAKVKKPKRKGLAALERPTAEEPKQEAQPEEKPAPEAPIEKEGKKKDDNRTATKRVARKGLQKGEEVSDHK